MAGTLDPLTVLSDGSFAPVVRPTTYTFTRTLAADTAEYINLPANTAYVVFGASTSFLCRYNAVQAGTGAAAFGDAAPDVVSEVNPTIRRIYGITELSVISKAACELSVTCYSI